MSDLSPRRFSLRSFYSCRTVSFGALMSLFLPLLLENACTYGFGLLNSSMISSSGMSALSAVSLVDTYTTIIVTFFQGIASGAAILVAQYHGAGKHDDMRSVAFTSITFVTLFGTVLAGLSILFRGFVVRLFFGAAEQDVVDLAGRYLLGTCLTLPLHAFWTAQLGVLRGAGESRVAMAIVVSNSVLYLVFNYLFLVVLDLSVYGLIWSIACTRLLTLLVCRIAKGSMHSCLRHSVRDLLHPDLSRLRRIFTYGFPISFENLLFNAGRLILLVIVTPMGTNAIAAYNIIYNIMMFSQIPFLAFSGSIFVVAGMCMGAGRPDDLREFYRKFLWTSVACYALTGGLILLFHGPIIAAFHPEPEMLPLILHCLVLIFLSEVLVHNQSFMTVNVLRACGDVVVPTVITAVSMWVFRVGGGWFLGRFLGLGVLGVYLGMCADWLFRGVVFTVRYRRGRWRTLHVIES